MPQAPPVSLQIPYAEPLLCHANKKRSSDSPLEEEHVLRVYSWAADARNRVRATAPASAAQPHSVWREKEEKLRELRRVRPLEGGPHPPTGSIRQSQRLRGRIRVAQDQSPGGFSLCLWQGPAQAGILRVICGPAPCVACTTRARAGGQLAKASAQPSRAESRRSRNRRGGGAAQSRKRARHWCFCFPLEWRVDDRLLSHLQSLLFF